MAATTDFEAHVAQLKEKLNKVKAFTWNKIAEERGVTIYRHEESGAPAPYMRGEAIFPDVNKALPIAIALADGPARKDYDTTCISIDVINKIRDDGAGNKLTVSHSKYHSPSRMVSERDFCFITVAEHDADANTALIISHSIPIPEIPEAKPFVRGELIISAFTIEPAANGMKINYYVAIDPKGWIPGSIVASASKEQPILLAKFIDHFKGKF